MTPRRTSAQLDFSHLPLLDHHCHPILRPEHAKGPLPTFLTESFDSELIERHGRHTLFFRRAVKDIAQLLGCDATPEAVEEARAALPLEKFFALACQEGKIEALLLDDGYLKEQTQPLEWHHRTTGCQVARVLRLEVLIQELIPEHSELVDLTAAFLAELDRAAPQIVGIKSIIAYRTGLDIRETPAQEAAAALVEVRRKLAPGQRLRIASKPLLDYLIPRALAWAEARGMPMQIHTGFGDRDIDLVTANPALLKPLLERHPTAKVILLHGSYPFTRQGAFLASMYRHVYLDLSEVIPYIAGDEQRRVVSEALGLAPVTKLLMATDASKVPDLYYLGAKHGRQALAEALGAEVRANRLDADEAQWAAQRILSENARELYLAG